MNVFAKKHMPTIYVVLRVNGILYESFTNQETAIKKAKELNEGNGLQCVVVEYKPGITNELIECYRDGTHAPFTLKEY